MNEPETPLSRRDAERLLDAPAARDDALGRALSAVNGPARPAELRREDATVAAFHSARLSPPPATRAAFVSPARLGSRAAIHAVVATGAVVAMASGGFALAGSLDLPSLPGQASDRATEAVQATRGATSEGTSEGATDAPGSTGSTDMPGSTATGKTSTSATDRPTGSPTASTSSAPSTPTGSSSATATPTPNLPGLCKAFQATDRSDDGSSLDSAALAALATAAGSADNIATYCVSLIGAPPTPQATPTGKPTDNPSPTGKPSPTDKPSPTGRPTDTPSSTGRPTDRPTPTGSPTDKPTGSPTDKPTGSPTDKPTGSPTDKPSPGKPTDTPEQSGAGGGRDSTTSGS